jgi:hypothetical protein
MTYYTDVDEYVIAHGSMIVKKTKQPLTVNGQVFGDSVSASLR